MTRARPVRALAWLAILVPATGWAAWPGDLWNPVDAGHDRAAAVALTAAALARSTPEWATAANLAVAEAQDRVLAAWSNGSGFAAGEPFERLRGRLRLPIARRGLNAGFGLRPRFTSPVVARHNGVSFAAGSGDPVRAVARGVVVEVRQLPGLGTTVLVAHDETFITVYAVLREADVAVGDPVDAGQKLGETGIDSPWGTPELYFEIRRDGVPLDPLPWFRAPAPTAPVLEPAWRRTSHPRS